MTIQTMTRAQIPKYTHANKMPSESFDFGASARFHSSAEDGQGAGVS